MLTKSVIASVAGVPETLGVLRLDGGVVSFCLGPNIAVLSGNDIGSVIGAVDGVPTTGLIAAGTLKQPVPNPRMTGKI